MKITRWLVTVGAVALPASVLLWLPTGGTRATSTGAVPVAVAQPAPTTAPVLRSGVVAALQVHDEMLLAAAKVSAPKLLPVASAAAAAGTVVPSPAQAVPDTPDAERIALFYTGNVIGETDPCG